MSWTSNPQPSGASYTSDETGVVYVGYRQRGRAIVEKYPGREPLTPDRSLKLADHSPSGFEWGYGGSGPAQLALALLLDYTDDEEVALAEYMAFKNEVVSQLECTEPDGCWRLTGREIDAALRETVDEPVAPSVN
ncbi:DUF6166 domain-containing protein [Halomarina litorea]|uniref:DUF6166 domain-containing protein n=1 Tax=Halomarina litorea TaxID=2961595 RepID=UPI0020C5334F|nr:DUF6166 domain-containing protein [Halomarina sp. BCD28]